MNKVSLHTANVFVKEMVDGFGHSNYFVSKQASKQASSVATCKKDIFDASVDMGEYYANRRFFYVTF